MVLMSEQSLTIMARAVLAEGSVLVGDAGVDKVRTALQILKHPACGVASPNQSK